MPGRTHSKAKPPRHEAVFVIGRPAGIGSQCKCSIDQGLVPSPCISSTEPRCPRNCGLGSALVHDTSAFYDRCTTPGECVDDSLGVPPAERVARSETPQTRWCLDVPHGGFAHSPTGRTNLIDTPHLIETSEILEMSLRNAWID